jgi:ABC-2 type transport system permease protein
MGEEEQSTAHSQNAVPPDFEQYRLVVWYELLKYLRSKRIIAMLVILVLILGLILGLFPALGENYPSDARAFAGIFVSFVTILVILSFTFFGADAIVSEFQQKTGYVLFPNPLKKWVILLGKFTASFLAAALLITLYYLAITASVGAINHSVPGELFFSYLFCLVYLMAGMAVAYFFSAIMKSAALAYALVFFFFLMIMNIINVMFMAADVKPWASLTFSSGIITYILEVPYPTDTSAEFISLFIPDIAIFCVRKKRDEVTGSTNHSRFEYLCIKN